MKRNLFLAIALVSCIGMYADQAEVRITITGETYPNLSNDNVYLMQNTWYSSAKDTSDIVKMMNPETQVSVYAISPNLGNLSTMQIDKLEGTYIGFHANANTNYKMTFDWLKGAQVLIRDLYEGTEFYATADQVYNFTVATAKTTYNDRFIIGGTHIPEFKICTTFDHVEIYDNEGADNIVITNAAGETVVDEAPVPVFQSIDLSGKPAGHYFLTVNGETYEFCNKPDAK